MRFIRAVGGYKMADHKRNEDVREELGITDINTTNDQNVRKKKPQHQIRKLLCRYKHKMPGTCDKKMDGTVLMLVAGTEQEHVN
jgi:hypothetical protein